MTDLQINLLYCTQVICDEIAQGLRQMDIAMTYAMAIKSEAQRADLPDWQKINEAIIARWSMSGLERIKARAHSILQRGSK